MFTINALQLIGIVLASAFIGSMIGFFAAAILAVGGWASEEEERWEWPEVKE